jgi:hypothetical protein
MRQKGGDLATIAELLGRSPKSGFAKTRRYAHLSIGDLYRAVSKISISTPISTEPVERDSLTDTCTKFFSARIGGTPINVDESQHFSSHDTVASGAKGVR